MNNLFYLSFVLILSVLLKSVTVIAEYADKDRSLEGLHYGEPHTLTGLEFQHFGDSKENPEHSGSVPNAAQKLSKDNSGYQHILKEALKAKLGENHEGYKTKVQEAKNLSKKYKRAAVSFLQNQAYEAEESSIEHGKTQGGSKEHSELFERGFNWLVTELLNVNAKSTIFNRLTQDIISDYKENLELTAQRAGRTSISFNINFANDEDSLDMVCDSFSFSVQTFYDTEKSDFKKGYFEAYLINENLDKYELAKPGEQLTLEQKVERRRDQCNAAYLQDSGRNKSDEFLFGSIKNETRKVAQQHVPAFPQPPTLLKSSNTSCPPCNVNDKRTFYNNGISSDSFKNEVHDKEIPITHFPHLYEPIINRNYRHLNDTGRKDTLVHLDKHVPQHQQVSVVGDRTEQQQVHAGGDRAEQQQAPEGGKTTQQQQQVSTGGKTTQQQQQVPTCPPHATRNIESNENVNDKQDSKKLLVKIKDLENKIKEKQISLKKFILECNKSKNGNYREAEIKKLIEEAGKNNNQQQVRPEYSTYVAADNTFNKLKAINTVMIKIEKSIVDGDMSQCRLNKHLLNKIINMSGDIFFTLSLSVLIAIIVMFII